MSTVMFSAASSKLIKIAPASCVYSQTYKHQVPDVTTNRTHASKLKSSADFVLISFMICGRNDAIDPIVYIISNA